MEIKNQELLYERIRLADEGYDIFGREARMFPPPVMERVETKVAMPAKSYRYPEVMGYSQEIILYKKDI